jgi:hypothetical protein
LRQLSGATGCHRSHLDQFIPDLRFYSGAMPNAPYAEFIEACRQERASLTGLIEVLEGRRMDPGAPIVIPPTMVAATASMLVTFQAIIAQLQKLIDAYEATPDA